MKTILVNTINAFVLESGEIFNEMYLMLEEYPNRKILLTSANDEQMEFFGLKNMPYEIFTLKHNPEKTNPNYFKIMLKHFNLSIDDVIYFENKEEAVKTAQLIGINTFHYNKNTKNLKELKKFIDKNIKEENR